LLLSRFFYALWMVVDLSHEVVAERFGQGVGTCLDSPFHVDAERADLARVPLERLVNVLIVVVRAYAEREVTAGHLGDPGLLWGRAVLVHTGWARRWGTAAYVEPDSPHLSAAAVEILVGANVALVGIDSGTVDDPADADRPARHALLGADIPIVEHLTNLDLLPDTGARLIALPPPVRGMALFPVRAVAVLPA
jgi:kynurenine formamidase